MVTKPYFIFQIANILNYLSNLLSLLVYLLKNQSPFLILYCIYLFRMPEINLKLNFLILDICQFHRHCYFYFDSTIEYKTSIHF